MAVGAWDFVVGRHSPRVKLSLIVNPLICESVEKVTKNGEENVGWGVWGVAILTTTTYGYIFTQA